MIKRYLKEYMYLLLTKPEARLLAIFMGFLGLIVPLIYSREIDVMDIICLSISLFSFGLWLIGKFIRRFP